MKLRTIATLITLLGAAQAALGLAQQLPGQASANWTIATAYPADTVSGHAAADFARTLEAALDGAAHVSPRFDFKTIAAALSEDSTRLPFALLFAGDLARKEPILALSVRPYSVTSIDEAREMAQLAKPAYRTALAHQGLVLLAVVPWPPTGIWSRKPIDSPRDFAGMRVRAYDESSRRVMARLGAQVVSLPIQEALVQLKAGAIDAIISSGDGDAGRAYADVLPNFTALRYAYPVSFLVASKQFLDGLSAQQRSAVFQSGAEAERLAWERLPERVHRNYRSMSAWGVAVHDPAPKSLIAAVERAARADTSAAIENDYETAQMLSQFHSCSVTRRACDSHLDQEAAR
ncbi:TRAP transporter substrate-binding protein DctP [Burkholderia pseudomallei]|uniref:TRAP transporter substrate-binding protein DctP n=1 Tax=Burkholderia TaxID=32008 RepID=UPI00158C4E53|nr:MULTISPECIES: TRAP transporter substrate-binding protein DctP [Burkholderia]MCV9914963.1 TRAP transporter substrate-binding protein DctP [Burkholderia pseudomallei]MCW0071001.1 TRAP transporter substrate-binding protein DctP [Burkholderia pseudomallei]